MKVTIDLPVIELDQSYDEAKHFIKQIELAVHHAQKSLDEMEKMQQERADNGEAVNENTFNVAFRVTDVEIYNEENREGNPGTLFLEVSSE